MKPELQKRDLLFAGTSCVARGRFAKSSKPDQNIAPMVRTEDEQDFGSRSVNEADIVSMKFDLVPLH